MSTISMSEPGPGELDPAGGVAGPVGAAPAPKPALGATAARGVVWAVGTTLLNKGTSIAAQLVVAAILLPEHLGTYAKALFVCGLVGQLLSPAVDQFLVSRAKEYDRFAAAALWLAGACGFVALLIQAALAPVAAHVQKNPALVYVIPLLGVGSMAAGMSASLSSRLSIELRFRRIAAISLTNSLVLQGLTVCGALAGLGVLALALPPVIVGVGSLLFYLATVPVPEAGRPHVRMWPEILRSSTRLMGVRTLQQAVGQGDYFILGLFATDAVVGVYYFAFNLAEQVARLLGASVSGVLTPSLAHIADDWDRARAAVLRASRLLSVFVTPLSVCQILLARPAIYALFGDKWLAAVPLIQIMSVAALVNVPAWPAGSLMVASGRFGELLRMWCVSLCIFVGCVGGGVWVGSRWGAEAAGYGAAVGSMLFVVVSTLYAVRVVMRDGSAVAAILKMLGRTVVIGLPGIVAVLALYKILPCDVRSRPQSFAFCCVGTFVFGILYLGVLRLVDPNTFGDVLGMLKLRRSAGGS